MKDSQNNSHKKSFILYSDQFDMITELSDEQAGLLLKHIYLYSTGTTPKITDQAVNVAFMSIKVSLDRDAEKYRQRCEKNKENVNKGRYGK